MSKDTTWTQHSLMERAPCGRRKVPSPAKRARSGAPGEDYNLPQSTTSTRQRCLPTYHTPSLLQSYKHRSEIGLNTNIDYRFTTFGMHQTHTAKPRESYNSTEMIPARHHHLTNAECHWRSLIGSWRRNSKRTHICPSDITLHLPPFPSPLAKPSPQHGKSQLHMTKSSCTSSHRIDTHTHTHT